MCPACFSTAALIAASIASTGGLAAIVIKKFGAGIAGKENAVGKHSVPNPFQEDDHVEHDDV